jgi:hypothetical protein
MKIQKLIVNIVIVIISISIGLLFCEIASRLILDPVDYLSPSLVRDNILGITLPPKSSGHDAWGFRNKSLKQSAEIVTLGDSHTYGNTAKMTESWPSVLARLTGKQVYNLALGGYGPNQYYYLLKTKALSLNPKVIICGLYMGDDFDNAYEITYGLDYWQYLRNKNISKRDLWDIWDKESSTSWHKNIRNWLSKNSMVYRLTIHGLFDKLKGYFQIKHSSDLYEDTASLIIKEKNIREAFRPKGVLKGLDQDSQQVREGMRITFQLIKEMNDICCAKNIQFVVAIIPTKESVFAEYLEHNKQLKMHEEIDSLIQNELQARSKLFVFLKNANIQYVDLLEPMKRAIERQGIYASSAVDMHPNNNGYKVIAESLAAHLITADKKN